MNYTLTEQDRATIKEAYLYLDMMRPTVLVHHHKKALLDILVRVDAATTAREENENDPCDTEDRPECGECGGTGINAGMGDRTQCLYCNGSGYQ